MEEKLVQLSKEVSHTLNVFKAKENLFSDFVKGFAEKVNSFFEKYKLIKESTVAIKNDTVDAKERWNSIVVDAKKIFKEIDFRVKTDKESIYKSYFPKTASTVFKRRGSLVQAFDTIVTQMSNETMESILVFKDRATDIYKKLKENSGDITDATTDKKFSKTDRETLYTEWKNEYDRLKLFIKGTLVGTKVKYSVFILDKKSTKKSTKSESKE